jgi:hypothetical protein
MRRNSIIAAVVATLTLTVTATAMASPSGTITLGGRISTGQLTASFYSTSDVVASYGWAYWFPYATRAAPGEPCIAGSSAVVYTGEVQQGGWQNSGTQAIYADAGTTICLWVDADIEYLVATAAVPYPPPPPPPAPAPTTTPTTTTRTGVYLTLDEAKAVLRRVLRREYGGHFTNGHDYTRTCYKRVGAIATTAVCTVRWVWRQWRYRGTVVIRETADGYEFPQVSVRRRHT